ncbi:hypothetical protein O7626_01080 [Micromonospora sp. WMMD1102]|uniref:hypothetical protein n=1 Tax=Micromonospora sp. WMMD1102 TaxID=3016105 RepID=UPI002415476A|nr:hypothetical protein [Micromonospora sp. WMMD1102]MDG4784539.1 hypothetical protein [Micromonospora sp. WMMD1102]
MRRIMMGDDARHYGGDSEQIDEGVADWANPPSAGISFLTWLAIGVLLGVAIVGLPPGLGLFADITCRTVAIAGIVALLVLHTRIRYYLPQMKSHRNTKVTELPDYQVNILQRSAGRRGGMLNPEIAGAGQARAFTFSVIYPANVRQRITERYELSQRTLVQRVTIDVQLPESTVRQLLGDRGATGAKTTSRGSAVHGSPGATGAASDAGGTRAHGAASTDSPHGAPVVLFPVLVPPKGDMVDDLRVSAADGSALPVLSYRQYLQLVARVLRTLLAIAHSQDLSPASHPNAYDAEHLALRAIMRRADGKEPDDSGIQAVRHLAGLPSREGERVSNLAAHQLAVQLVQKLTSHYAIVAAVPCPSDGRFVISYQRLITPSLELAVRRNRGWLTWAKERARFVLGSRPVDFSISLDNACTSQSYHLVVDGQEGVFLGAQGAPTLLGYFDTHWRRIKESRKSGPPREIPPPPYFRFRRRGGQRYAHFYSRFFPEPIEGLDGGDKIPHVRFRFYETPPGSVFRAVITGSAAALLIWLIGFVASRRPDPGTDVPAFLLVFPALAAAWLGFDGPPRRLLEGTLAARLSLLTTVLASVSASGLFMMFKANLPYFRWRNPLDIHVLGIESMAWSALTLVAIVNAMSIGYIYLAHTWEFLHLSNRSNGLGGGAQEHS